MALALIGIFFLLFAGPALAYQIESEHLEVFHREGKAVFTGNVVVRDDTGEISARRMEVYYEDDGDTIKYIEAYGNVKIIRDNLFARGQRAEYTVGADTLILEEEAYIKDDQGEFYADWMWIDLASEKLRMQGNIKALLSRESEDENQ